VVVGTGFGILTHVRAMRAAGIDVIALVGRDAAKTADRAARFDVPNALTDVGDAIGLRGVDAVAVVTPPRTHRPIVLDAVAAGKHVVCEKPFALDESEAREMLQAADHAGTVHMLGTEWRFGTGQAQLARTIRSGVIGEPRHALFELQLPTHADPGAELPDWWQLESEGGGWLGAYGSHIVDQVRSTLGEIVGVSATVECVARRPGMTADDTYTVHARLASDAAVVMHSSCAARGQFVATTKIVGRGGAAWLQGDDVWVDIGAGPEAVPAPTDLPPVAPDPPPTELLQTAYDMWHSMGIDLAPYTRLYGVLRDRALGRPVADDPVPATFADGVAGQAVLDAVRASSAAGGEWKPVNVESAPRR
jgi:predicted dehydrogenase